MGPTQGKVSMEMDSRQWEEQASNQVEVRLLDVEFSFHDLVRQRGTFTFF